MSQRSGSYFHLHLVSDATGETLTTVARAATAQYTTVLPVEHVYPLVRTQKQLDRVLAEIEESPGIVLYTLLEDDLLKRLENHCRELGLPCLSILGPVLQLLQSYLGTETSHRVGAQEVERLAKPLVVGLYASPERIVQIRQNRLLGLNAHWDNAEYIDRKAVAEEVAFSRKLCARHSWPSIDVTRRSIEETAAAVMSLLTERRRHSAA